ncbi:MAG: tetratricopeptide repeat protein [Saprospiraceae bacterium]|nr:tetratricopeptide repeat protein [Saprospiraceae bacterium]HMW38784.1 tetratricopeptide repeat protein [Saprospiraceae bacterium]HMX88677.1 tetratricopeptide repeat protein [Saprospiraceae bacterium]HMZ40109.1 tetratricopeptide repeat protein [Saprospiraceae bacterium]HNA64828.1 tetratricopeptide repeat protein [Saprospiraceae bacterium]
MNKWLNDFLLSPSKHITALIVLSLLFYVNTLSNDFAVDDSIVIVKNEYVRKGLSGIPDILNKDTFRGFFKTEGKDKLVSGGRYRPLSLILFACIFQFFGDAAWIYHLVNILLYTLLGVLLYKVLGRMLDRLLPKESSAIAFLASVIFIIHPVHTECVANIKGADEMLALLLSLSSAWYVLRWLEERRMIWIIFAMLSLGFAMFSKENSVAWLALIPAGLWLMKKAEFTTSARIFVLLVIPVFVFLYCRAQILGWNPIAGQSAELMNNPFLKFIGGNYIPFTAGEKLGTIFYTLLRYIGLLFFPHPLTYDYYPKHINMHALSSLPSLLSLIIHIAMLGAVWIFRQSRPMVSFALLAYLIPLFIVSNLLFSVGTFMGERFLFMPSVGFSLLMGWLLYRLIQRNFSWVPFAVIIIIGLSAMRTITRNKNWKDDLTLILHDIQISPNSAKLNTAVGGILLEKYSGNKDTKVLQEKIAQAKMHLRRAIDMHPYYFEAHNLLGNAFFINKEYKDAVARYDFILKYRPEDRDARNNLALSYRELGRVTGMNENNPAQAIEYLNRSLQIKNNDEETISLLGVAYGVLGKYNEALTQFNKVLELNPRSAMAYFNLYLTYVNMGDQTQAETMLAEAKAIDPDIQSKFNQGSR